MQHDLKHFLGVSLSQMPLWSVIVKSPEQGLSFVRDASTGENRHIFQIDEDAKHVKRLDTQPSALSSQAKSALAEARRLGPGRIVRCNEDGVVEDVSSTEAFE